jgi:hypothetical protein
MHQPFFVQEIQRGQHRRHHARSFLRRKRALPEQFAQIFAGQLRHHK